ncbi:glycosyltransferase [Geotalea daltonii FRC-32]|uniref:Glycosyltransferase n=1 Tax=Geotalea daltonii (strain DSM 22248 / JCM 15807 / FRC-32) TaxID=316067 RepID=B9M8Z1_GEODF|nr:glycosyltransferase family 4 protein [Geotalea daltonii]ACM20487.1 glycosyltransferase [Geotalea daltonii FRC-32]
MIKEQKPKILTLVGFYLPGYKAGGPLRTIANMVEHLNDYEFWIITRDRDLGDESPYEEIKPDKWQRVGNAMVHYLSPERCTIRRLAVLIAETSYDVLYINSFFDPFFTVRPLLARKLGLLPNKPVIIAPRGEFSEGAIKIKRHKKHLFIKLAGLIRLYANVVWHASSTHEAQDVLRVLGMGSGTIHVALDLPSRKSLIASGVSPQAESADAVTRVVFLSRISPKKNLDYALKALSKVKQKILFNIYGPAEDQSYWNRCQETISQLPANISVKYWGAVHPDQVSSIFNAHDLFFFPTRGENYGHVIAEALSVGTAVLLSDQTPWRDLQSEHLGWDLPLENIDEFARIIEEYAIMPIEEKLAWRKDIISKTTKRLSKNETIEANRSLFMSVVNK